MVNYPIERLDGTANGVLTSQRRRKWLRARCATVCACCAT